MSGKVKRRGCIQNLLWIRVNMICWLDMKAGSCREKWKLIGQEQRGGKVLEGTGNLRFTQRQPKNTQGTASPDESFG
jgi:hypothetical protein